MDCANDKIAPNSNRKKIWFFVVSFKNEHPKLSLHIKPRRISFAETVLQLVQLY